MTHIVQRDGQQPLETLEVYYDGSDELLVGYNVCYDITASLTDPESDWSEKVRGRVVVKPATANLKHYAGVVVKPPQKRIDPAGTYKGWCTIARLRAGTWLKAYTNADMNLSTKPYLKLANNSFALVAEATTGTTYGADTIAVVGETADTSGTAANKLVMGLKG